MHVCEHAHIHSHTYISQLLCYVFMCIFTHLYFLALLYVDEYVVVQKHIFLRSGICRYKCMQMCMSMLTYIFLNFVMGGLYLQVHIHALSRSVLCWCITYTCSHFLFSSWIICRYMIISMYFLSLSYVVLWLELLRVSQGQCQNQYYQVRQRVGSRVRVIQLQMVIVRELVLAVEV